MKAFLPTAGFLTVVLWLWIGGVMWWTTKAVVFFATAGIPDAPSLIPFYGAIAFAALETAVLLYHRHILRRAFIVMSVAPLFAALMFISYGTYRAYEATLQAAGGHLHAGGWSDRER